jgi:hypothetical protein
MADGNLQKDVDIYETGFWHQLRRYGNPTAAMEHYLNSFNGAKKIVMISGGPRLLAVISAIPSVEEIQMVDIFPGPLEATEDYMKEPQKFWQEYPILQDEIDFLDKKGLGPRLDDSLIKLNLRDHFNPNGDYDGVMAEEVALHPPPKDLGEHTLPILLEDAQHLLKQGGRFIFSFYPGDGKYDDTDNGLIHHFNKLVNNPCLNILDGNWIRIDRVAKYLEEVENETYNQNKEIFWLDGLSKIRIYSEKEILRLLGDRYSITEKKDICGGMFPFARRTYFTLESGS